VNLLFVGGFSFRDGGGVGRVSRTLAAEFVRQGHECSFLATKPGQDEIVEGVPQLFVPNTKVNATENKEYLRKVIAEKQINVIINQTGFDDKVFDLVQSVLDDCVVLTAHHNCVACLQDLHQSIISHTLSRLKVPLSARPNWAMHLLKARSRRKTGRCIERICLNGDGIVLLAKPFVRELSVFTDHIDLSKVFPIPNPCPFSPDPTALAEKEKSVLYVGRLENGQKRVDRLLEIWSKLGRDFQDWRLDIVGDGGDAECLKKQVREMNLKRLCFHGSCDPVPFYRKATVLLLPSDFEGFGMVLVEAQAFGCIPVEGDSFSAIQSVIANGKSGYVVEKQNIEAYCNKAALMMTSSPQVASMQRAALKQALRFHPERIAGEWLKCIQALASKRGVSYSGMSEARSL
jgi:glycosyltransferase involved in cell wall biosynthesis